MACGLSRWIARRGRPAGQGQSAGPRCRGLLAAATLTLRNSLSFLQLKAPVVTTADQKQRAKKNLKPGNVFGMARQG